MTELKNEEVEVKEIEAVTEPLDEMRPKTEKKNKKLIYGVIAAIVVIALCIGAYAYSEQQRKQKILDSIQVTFVEDLTIEYGSKDFDYNTLIKEKSDEVILPDAIDTMALGEKEIIYKVEKEGLTKEFPIKVSVTDTQAPEITFKENVVSLEYGAEFDVKDNIESIKDPIDGDIPYSESAGENNYYIIDGTVDTSTVGDHNIMVKAVDKNGNESEKAYTVTVAEEYVAPTYDAGTGYTVPTYQQPSSGGGYTAPPASSGNSSSTSSGTTCDKTPQGMTYDEAVAEGHKQALDKTNPNYMKTPISGPIFNSCGDVVGYQIQWR